MCVNIERGKVYREIVIVLRDRECVLCSHRESVYRERKEREREREREIGIVSADRRDIERVFMCREIECM